MKILKIIAFMCFEVIYEYKKHCEQIRRDPEHFISDTKLGYSSLYTWELHLDLFPSPHYIPCNTSTWSGRSAAFSRNHGYVLFCLPLDSLRTGELCLATSGVTQQHIERFSRSSLGGSASRPLPVSHLLRQFVCCVLLLWFIWWQ